MSGLLALLDDVAAFAKLAAAQVDDVAGQAAKVGSKAAGVVVDDAAVTPKYVTGLPAAREIPIVAKIARGSLYNKLVILLPVAMLLNAFAPWALMPLLMIGGAYLCFEGAEKVLHAFHPASDIHHAPETLDAAHLERERVAGAIKTDFILSAEIMTISLAAIEADSLWVEGAVLAAVAVGITVLVYGGVAVLVKADDLGLRMHRTGRLAATRALGLRIVHGMPAVMGLIGTVGTAAMLWVGGSIVIHGLDELGIGWLGHRIHDLAYAAGHALPQAEAAVEWAVTAALDGVFGLALGSLLIPVAHRLVNPLMSALRG